LYSELLKAVEMEGLAKAIEVYERRLESGSDAWEIHLALFPVVQQVLNPPFINPHLPKMYNICREFLPYLEPEDIPSLVRLEITEYTRRVKLDRLEKVVVSASSIHFADIEDAIGERNWKKTAALMEAFHQQQGGQELTRRLLLLGSGYLNRSLGHSISCTAFILLEMLERKNQDPWPVLTALADYFCKGRFAETPELITDHASNGNGAPQDHLLRAVSGRGILNLHYPITLYAMERVRFLFDEAQYNHLIAQWIKFMGDKTADRTDNPEPVEGSITDYAEFTERFTEYDMEPILQWAAGMIETPGKRTILGRYLIKAVCDQYQGRYNPHNLTGLGSTLWIMENWWDQPEISLAALYQFVDYFFDDVRPKS
jgi:hypothetical protein